MFIIETEVGEDVIVVIESEAENHDSDACMKSSATDNGFSKDNEASDVEPTDLESHVKPR